VLAGGGIAGEADAGAGGLAQVAEDHGLHVDGCAQPVVDVVDAAIGLGAVVLQLRKTASRA
jgi:UDP-N-acetylmuramate-alanine ligase